MKFTYLNIGRILFFLMFSVQAGVALAQTPVVENVDTAFERARELAFDGEREKARELAYAILDISPNYHDVRILIARTFAWDGEYNSARTELEYVLQRKPGHKDALFAAIDNEKWAGNYQAALDYSEQAAKHHSVDPDVLYKRAQTFHAANQDEKAIRVLNQLEKLDRTNQEAKELRTQIKSSRQDYTLTASYTYDTYEDVYGDINKSSISLSRRTNAGSVIGRVNLQDRFGSRGLQAEVDYYPSIAEGWYGYVSAGYSGSFLFPDFRAGSELYKNLPASFEVSVGFRYLNFNSNVWIYTGSLSKYYGNWLFTLRPYLTPNSAGVSRSFNLLARRYFSGPENYITLRGGFGFYPEERRFQDVEGDVFFTESQFIGLDGYKELRFNLAAFISLDFARQELTFAPGSFIHVITLNGGFVYKF